MLSPFAPDPDHLTDREREQARRHPERETLPLAASGAAQAAKTMDRVDLWRARLALKTLRADQRQAIAADGLL